MKVLVTGGSGFIGSAVVHRLCQTGHEVVVADLRAPRAPAALAGDGEPKLPAAVVGDLRQAAVLERALSADVDAVIHLAAATSVLRSLEAPVDVYEHNVALTQSLLERCRQLGVSRFLFASTNAVVGMASGSAPISESSPLAPMTPYGATKAAAEMLMSAYRAAYGITTTALRLTNVYGPGMSVKDTMVPRIIRAALADEPVQIYGDGLQRRDYVFVEDVVDVFVAGLDRELPSRLVVGSGTSISVLDLHEAACRVFGRQISLTHVAAPQGEMPAVVVDRSLAAGLGWPEPVTLDEGLRLTWEWWQKEAS